MTRAADDTCRRCGVALPAVPPGPGRPPELCDRCRIRRRPPIVPVEGELTRAVDREYGGASDDSLVLQLRLIASRLDGATHGSDVVALSREFPRSSGCCQRVRRVAGRLGVIRWTSCASAA